MNKKNYKSIVNKESFFTGKELHKLKIANLEKIKVADRQGLLVPIVIDRPHHQAKGLNGNIYAIDGDKLSSDDYKKLNSSVHSKKLYYGDNINFWLANRIDPDLVIPGSKKGTVLRRLSDKQIKDNYKFWSEKFDKKLNQFLPKDFKSNKKYKKLTFSKEGTSAFSKYNRGSKFIK
tara:strand:- start:192 stop:719 length:528 start_codon:yes stop_codon:yes gene_type:complete